MCDHMCGHSFVFPRVKEYARALASARGIQAYLMDKGVMINIWYSTIVLTTGKYTWFFIC